MATVQFDLVSPERKLASALATEVQIPATEGDMTAMAGHLPTITTLRPGLLRVVHAGGTDTYLVSGGFAEISATSVSVLAESAVAAADVTAELVEGWTADLRASGLSAEVLDKKVNDLTAAVRAL